jgi:uracil-DNA glycosylase
VDAKDRLRRYLEQRRELGETELVLDGMSVEEVLRMIGAVQAGGRTERSLTPPPAEGIAGRASSEGPGAAPAPEPPAGADWRETLRASGGAPDQLGGRGTGAKPGSRGMGAEKKTASPNVTGDRDRDAATARSGSGSRSDEGMGSTPAPGAATPEAAVGEPAPAPRGPVRELDVTGVGAPAGLSVGAAAGELFGGPFGELATLDEIAATVAGCQRCPLYATAINPVPGEGNPNADLVCVGEAPGANEDETGRPFVGAAGQLLTKILAAIKLAREDVFICNVLKHRPPGNRNPKPDEVEACSPYLVRQLELIRPKVIVAFGTFAAQTLLNTKTPIGKLRGSVHRYYGIPLIVTYHPAALLRNPAWKRPTWEDVQLARRILDHLAAA